MRKSLARVAAMLAGQRTYVPENPCARGHALRSTSGGSCLECRRMTEKTRTQANREAYNARKKQERAHKKEVFAERMRVARANETPEKRAARLLQARIKQRTWRLLNPAHPNTKKAKQQYKKQNPAKVLADTVKRRAAKMQRTPKWLTADDAWMLEQAYELAILRTKLFGFSWHVDHIIPLQGKTVSGLHVPTNVQVIPWRDNVAKANRFVLA